jgi:hypothetical protein
LLKRLKRANGLGSEDEEQTIIREYPIKEIDFTSKNVVIVNSWLEVIIVIIRFI